MTKELTPGTLLRILTSNVIDAKDIALLQGCNIKTARKIADDLSGTHLANSHHRCGLDDYLEKYKKTTKCELLHQIYSGFTKEGLLQ